MNGLSRIPSLQFFLSFSDSETDIIEKKKYIYEHGFQPYDLKKYLLKYLFQDVNVLAAGSVVKL